MKNTVVTAQTQSLPAKRSIPYVNIARQHSVIKKQLLEAIGRVIDGGHFILGEEVQAFEERFAKLCNVPYAVAVNSGTDALIFALRILEIGKDDEVITVPNSFVSSTSCITIVGAKPIFVDVGEDYNIDVNFIERAITKRTKAILPVHLTGRPVQMDRILKIVEKYRLALIEDCAQAVLAEYSGKRVGSFGDLGCFSLHPLKTLSACGDGGVITTRNESYYTMAKRLRNLGLENRDNCVLWSGNSRLDTIQAASLLVKMNYVNEWTEKRRRNAQFYRGVLSGLSSVQLPTIDQPEEKAVYHTFVIQADRRNELKNFLETHGIGTAIHYPLPIHLQPIGRSLGYGPGSFPVAERLAERALSLPIYPELDEEELEYVADHIRAFYQE